MYFVYNICIANHPLTKKRNTIFFPFICKSVFSSYTSIQNFASQFFLCVEGIRTQREIFIHTYAKRRSHKWVKELGFFYNLFFLYIKFRTINFHSGVRMVLLTSLAYQINTLAIFERHVVCAKSLMAHGLAL